MRKAILLTLLFLVFMLGSAFAANHYVTQNGSGTKSGADWSNACAGFSGNCAGGSLVRGDTYYVASGSYGNVTFSAGSGTSVVTIMGVTATNHGTDTGWSSSNVGQAVFTGATINTGYFTFDGQVRGSAACQSNSANCSFSDWRTGYTLKFSNTNHITNLVEIASKISNVSFKYVEFSGANTSGIDDFTIYNGGGGVSSLYVGYSYLHNTGNSQIQMNDGTYGQNSGLTVEYSWIYKNHCANDATHDEGFAIVFDNIIVRYNVFQDITSTGVITNAAAGDPSVNNWQIYGNVFFWDPAWVTDSTNVGLANGVIGLPNHDASSGSFYFYNNTIFGIKGGWANSGVDTPNGGATKKVLNNLWYDASSPSCTYNYSPQYAYNSYYACGNTGCDSGNNIYQTSSAPNIFTNTSAFDFSLTSATTAGLTLASPYDKDMFGNTRGADGTWDRGAFEFGSVSGPGASLSSSSLSFGNQVLNSTSVLQAVTLTNNGTATLSISSIAVTGANASDFAQSNNCGSSLAMLSSCTINVTFNPSALGVRSASVTITDNAASGSPQTVTLSGTGVNATPGASLSVSSLAFGNQLQGTASASKAVVLTNNGTAVLSISGISVTGTNASDFSQTNNCGSSLAISANCTINVTFTPSVLGARLASVSVADNAAGSPQSVALSGTGLSATAVGLLHVVSCGDGAFPATVCTISSTNAHSLLVVGWSSITSTATVTGITDNKGDSFVEAGSARAVDGSNSMIDIWYAKDVAAGVMSITITPSPSGADGGAVIWEVANIDTVSPLDKTGVLNSGGPSATPSGPTLTTTFANEFVVSAISPQNTVSGITSGNAFTNDSTVYYNGWAHLITTTTGTFNAQWNVSSSGTYASSAVAFKPVGTTAPPSYHPADTNGDWKITSPEFVAYGTCWKAQSACNWNGTGNISSQYYVNAANLWKTTPFVYHYLTSGCVLTTPGTCWASGAN